MLRFFKYTTTHQHGESVKKENKEGKQNNNK